MTTAKLSTRLAMGGIFLGIASAFFGASLVAAQESASPTPDPLKPAFVEGEVLIKFKPEIGVGLSRPNSLGISVSSSTSSLGSVREHQLLSRFKDLQLETTTLFSESADASVTAHSVQNEGSGSDELVIGIAHEAGKTTEQLISSLEKDPAVSLVQPNYRYYPEETTVPAQNYENTTDLWNIYNNPQNAGVRADTVWKQGYTGQGVVVAVIDTGVDMTQPDLAANIWTNPGETDCHDNIDDDSNGFIDDCHGWDFGNNDNDPSAENPHGTHNSGTIASKRDNLGTVGIAPDAKIMPIRIFTTAGTATTATIVSAIDYAWKNGAKVINMSLGSSRSTCPAIETEVIKKAFDGGVFMVASSGNGGAGSPQAPALCQYVFAVGATDDQKKVTDYSGSYLNVVEGVAPGNKIFSTAIGGEHSFSTGTSMAVPHVSGIAALLLSAKPDLTPSQIADTLCKTAEDLNEPGRDERSGCGFISAEKAIAAVATKPPPPPEYCHAITNPETSIPATGFAPPYNLFSLTNELLMKVNCTMRKAELGNGKSNLFIYRKGFKADPTKKWQQISYSGNQPNTAAWFQGNATLDLEAPLPENILKPHYLLSYLCTLVGDQWKCGCKDEVCKQSFWSLQVYYPS